MKIEAGLHRSIPIQPAAAIRELADDNEVSTFFIEAVQRVAKGISKGEVREIGASIKVTG